MMGKVIMGAFSQLVVVDFLLIEIFVKLETVEKAASAFLLHSVGVESLGPLDIEI